MPAKDPVSDALLNVYNLYADRRQAELDLERARTAEQVGARSAVPGVMAQLAEQDLKHRKQREQIQKAQEQGQMSPAAMLPPLTEVDGNTSSRRAAMGAAAAEEIQKAVSGGAAAKSAGPLGAAMMAGGSALGPAGAVMLGQQGAAPAGGAMAQPAAQGPVASSIQQAQAAAGPGAAVSVRTVVPTTKDELGTRIFRGLLNVLGARSGFGGLGSTIFPQPDQVVVETTIPGQEERAQRQRAIAGREAGPLAVLIREGRQKMGTKEAGEAGKAIVDQIDHLQKSYGNEVALETTRLAGIDIVAKDQAEREAMERAVARAGITADAAAQRAAASEARRQARPEVQFKEDVIAAQRRVAAARAAGQLPDAKDTELINAYTLTDPMKILERNIAEGINAGGSAAKPPTQGDVDKVYSDLQAAGKPSEKDDVKAELRRRGFAVP